MPKKQKQPLEPVDADLIDTEENEEEQLLGGGSTLSRGQTSGSDEGERQLALQRDNEPDDFDESTDVNDDRVRGAGGQSLDDLAIRRGLGKGLEEHAGGIRFDRPEPNADDEDLDEEAV